MGYATKGGGPQGTVPASAFLGLPALGRDSGKRDIPSQTHFRTFLSPLLPPATYMWLMDKVVKLFFFLSGTRIWNLCMYIPELLGLKLIWESFPCEASCYILILSDAQNLFGILLVFIFRSLCIFLRIHQQWRYLVLKSKFFLDHVSRCSILTYWIKDQIGRWNTHL